MSKQTRWKACSPWALLAACLAAGPAASAAPGTEGAEPPLDGPVTLTLDAGVPFEGRNQPALLPAYGGNWLDLRMELVCRKGTWDKRVWAWTACIPAMAHTGVVREVEVSAAAVRLVVELTFRHHLPFHLGGKARYVLNLRHRGPTVAGTFSAVVHGVQAKEQRQALLSEWGGGDPCGEVLSKTLDGLVIGRVWSKGLAEPTSAPSRPLRRPHLLFGPAGVSVLRTRAEQPRGRDIVEQVRRALGITPPASGPASRPAETVRRTNGLDGEAYVAAGWALLYRLTGRKEQADKAAEWAKQAAETPAVHPAAGIPRKLAGLAVAYDLACEAWPQDVRRTVAEYLEHQARQIATFRRDYSVPWPLSMRPWAVQGPYDYRLAMSRAAAGLAMLAVRSDVGAAEARQLDELLVLVERSLARFLSRGIGERGCGAGSFGYDEVMETLLPFLQAFRRATGRDLAAGSGVGGAALWGMMTRGASFSLPPQATCGHWLPFTLGALPAEHLPIARYYLAANPCIAPTPYHGLFALLNLPPDGPAAAPAELPLSLEDRLMGGYVFRSGWDDTRDFVTVVRRAAGPFPASHLSGDLRVFGLGRGWLVGPSAAFGKFSWPMRAEINAVQFRQAALVNGPPVYPVTGAQLLTARAGADGSGCLAMVNDAFSEADARDTDVDGLAANQHQAQVGHCKRTIGIDYSGASGAEALLVLLDEVYGFYPRQLAWQVHVGDVPSGAVEIRENSFLIRPPGASATMRGTFLHPHTISLRYHPPSKAGTTAGGRIEAWFRPPQLTNEQLFDEARERLFDTVIREINLPDNQDLTPPSRDEALQKILAEVHAPNLDKLQRQRKRRQLDAYVLYQKLREQTISIKQGAGDRMGRAQSSFLVVLTIQSGDPPDVQVYDSDHRWWFAVGGQSVTYRQNLVTFGKPK